jgi:soluble lytic murein transglycosylase-like protein/predicted small secreted protein
MKKLIVAVVLGAALLSGSSNVQGAGSEASVNGLETIVRSWNNAVMRFFSSVQEFSGTASTRTIATHRSWQRKSADTESAKVLPEVASSSLKAVASKTVKTKTSKKFRLRDKEDSFDHIIEEASEVHNLDPHLVKAVISKESQFDPRAVSHKGAKGLMQLMPGNYRSMRIDPFDPEENIHGGSKLLATYMKQFGSTKLALAAYNAGPERVKESNYSIPNNKETKTFVKEVMSRYHSFKNEG